MKKTIVAASVAALAFGGLVAPSFAAAGDKSLSGSVFEIEEDANTTVDTATASVDDWAEVPASRIKADEPSGTSDDSFGQGTKEDTAVPTVVSGSIPPNKSDLKEFGTYQEGDAIGGFFHLFWSRVQDPSGTTNMDFELNQSDTLSSNGVTYVRTAGDLLITYDLDKGGKVATMSKRVWDGNKWGSPDAFTSGDAIGTINTSSIAAEAGLGPYSPRTFGEASVKTEALFGTTTACKTFGTAYVKSRSSDSFTAAVKDFIAPVPINLTNCGQVKIVKKDDAGSVLAGAEFTLYQSGASTGLKCTTVANGECTISNVPFGSYVVKETVTPPGHDTAADQNVTISSSTPTRTLNFVNPRQRGAIKVTKTYGGSAAHAGVTFTVDGVSKQTDANGVACFDNLLFGTYAVTETVPTGFVASGANPKNVTVDNKASCSDATYVGETVSFDNTPLSKIAVGFAPQVAGATDATIECKKGGTTLTGVSAFSLSGYTRAGGYIDLTPGTYVCTVVISTSSS